ncbi:enoyl-CoA hydratase/carnithine racemase [Lipingzhangella halophila]|uniref:Enoyl-CoA hydratase/carnithine racemase n=1 Tax=Lipingzhangella halophila TaxID=1783352 RepID=A0A7W7RFT9_9ACTN|nr:enoyl-CoA hydratase-related protein [Lipingzhangella halophila]MBB4930893.1 enoyl-CoA hydratase/carnithine racemase [Lipingzhangella halophila]
MRASQRDVLVNDDAGVRSLVLNRPTSRNAINYDVLEELESAVAAAADDDSVRALVVRGEGQVFCAGDDLKGMGTQRTPLPEDAKERADLGYPRFVLALRNIPKPVIAQVHGAALGAGCDLAFSCDIVFAAEGARFGLVFAARGMVSGTALLPSLVGYHRACELLFSADTFTAEQAGQWGLVNHVVPADDLDQHVTEYARRLAAAPTAAIGLMKRAINESRGQSLESAVETQRSAVAESYQTHDYYEGGRAFTEKREPRFIGR